MGRLALLLLPLLAAGLAAEEQPITDEELEPLETEFRERMEAIRKGELKAEVVARYHAQQVESAPDRRSRAKARFLYGRFLQVTERYKEAQQELGKAVEDWPAFPAGHVASAALLAAGGDVPRAEEAAKQALRIQPDYVRAYIVLGNLAMFRKDWGKARDLLEQSIEIEPTREGGQLLVQAYVQLWEEALLPKEKDEQAGRAIAVANGLLQLYPKAPELHLFRAQILDRLGDTGAAANALEKSFEEIDDERARLVFLRVLRGFYQKLQRRDLVEATLNRILERKDLDGRLREECEEDLRLLREKGQAGFGVMMIYNLLRMLENQGISASERRQYLRILLDLFSDEGIVTDPAFQDVLHQVHDRVLRILIKAPPPELMLEMLRFFRRSYREPRLLRILVFYIYPEDDRNKTAEVRAEAVRTIAAICGVAGLPTLLHSLQDDAPEVVREVDKALSDHFGVRSRAGGDGFSPLTTEEIVRARQGWRAHAHTQEGAVRLAAAIEGLRTILAVVPERGDQKSRPVADHVVSVILLDNDMPFEAWAPAYSFLVDYLGRDSFRPPDRRGQPVTAEERPRVVKELLLFWQGKAGTRLEEDEEKPPPASPDAAGAAGRD